MQRKTVTRLLLKATDGLLGATTDTLLVILYLQAAMVGKRGSQAMIASREAREQLEMLNYQTIKGALHTLVHTKHIWRKPTTKHEYRLTALGRKRIAALLPTYLTDRPWDGHIYLISYDIPTQANSKRTRLRTYIRKTGGALLQESLWINPYNPMVLLENFQQKNHIPGTILVSRLGQDGTIGRETLEGLIKRVYHLDHLADRYTKFIHTYSTPTETTHFRLTMDYLSILKDDPQLPFPLLPSNFPGEKAFMLFHTLCQK